MKKILGILFFFLVIGAGCTTNSMRYDSAITSVVDNEYTIEESQIIKNKKIVGYDYLLISPNGTTTTLPKEFSKDFKFEFKNGSYDEEAIASFEVPTNPENKNEIIFSTIEYLDGEGINTINRIYKYNLETKQKSKLFEEKNKNSLILRTVGREGSKIIIYQDLTDNSPGICNEILIDSSNLLYFDLKDTPLKFEKYTVPLEKINEVKAKQKQCLKEEGIEN